MGGHHFIKKHEIVRNWFLLTEGEIVLKQNMHNYLASDVLKEGWIEKRKIPFANAYSMNDFVSIGSMSANKKGSPFFGSNITGKEKLLNLREQRRAMVEKKRRESKDRTKLRKKY